MYECGVAIEPNIYVQSWLRIASGKNLVNSSIFGFCGSILCRAHFQKSNIEPYLFLFHKSFPIVHNELVLKEVFTFYGLPHFTFPQVCIIQNPLISKKFNICVSLRFVRSNK